MSRSQRVEKALRRRVADLEEDRRCYAHPTCHACLPPPPPHEVLVIGEAVQP